GGEGALWLGRRLVRAPLAIVLPDISGDIIQGAAEGHRVGEKPETILDDRAGQAEKEAHGGTSTRNLSFISPFARIVRAFSAPVIKNVYSGNPFRWPAETIPGESRPRGAAAGATARPGAGGRRATRAAAGTSARPATAASTGRR